jgi:hypothetical protein
MDVPVFTFNQKIADQSCKEKKLVPRMITAMVEGDDVLPAMYIAEVSSPAIPGR